MEELQSYLGVKVLQAEPMTLGDYNKHKGWTIPEDEDPNRPGYRVVYPDGYVSWSPKEVFEQSYLLLTDPTRITPEEVATVLGGDPESVTRLGEKTTVAQFVASSGFEIVESSSCVDPANYNEALGTSICRKRAEDQLWGFLGFVLQWGKKGIKRPATVAS